MEISRMAQMLTQVSPELPSPAGGAEAPASGPSFSEYLKQSVGEVNSLLKEADQLSQDLVTGKSQNLHETMIGFEKAETALKLLVQVRNKALDAYQQIMQMQV